MKEPIRKISILAHTKDKKPLLEQLRAIGLLHLEITEQLQGPAANALLSESEQARKALATLEQQPRQTHSRQPVPNDQFPEKAVAEIRELSKKASQLQTALEASEKQLNLLAPWGNYDPQKFRSLAEEHNLSTAFYIASAKNFDSYNFGQQAYQVISRLKGQVYFVALSSKEQPANLPFMVVSLPEQSSQTLQKTANQQRQSLEQISKQISDYLPYQPIVGAYQQALTDEIRLLQAKESFEAGQEETVVYLHAWFLLKDFERLEEGLAKLPLAYVVRKPTKSDDIPVVLKNNAYTKLYEPITRIFQLPGYYEFDLTPFIAVFFPIFFAYCLGDAGYGLVVLAASVYGYFKFLKAQRNFAILGMILGVMTAFMGIVKSGTIFGLSIVEQPDIAWMAALSDFVFISGDAEFNVALLLGVIQIIIAVIIAGLKTLKYESKSAALSPLGKLLIISSVIVLFLGGMQGVESLSALQEPATWTLYTGILLVLLFHDMDVKLIARLGMGVLPLFFIFTGILGDILSYVRLFALGVASAVLGLVVNVIGMQIWDAGWYGPILAVPFLLFGHGLNFSLAALGAFVHPLRLTFVEFYNNAGFKGGGKTFTPFAQRASG